LPPTHFRLKGATMKKLAGFAIAFGLFCTPAVAQTMDMSTVKCRDMAANSAEKNAMILMWLQGYYSDEDASPIIDFDKMGKDVKKLGEYCEKHPDHSIITAADESLDD
jgi:acid stress chaperone HdeB